jgi:hypothetical protein
MKETKVPDTPKELAEMQITETLFQQVVSVLNENQAHPCDVIGLTLELAELIMYYHVDFLKEQGPALDTTSRIAWEDDVANLMHAVKYLGRVRR